MRAGFGSGPTGRVALTPTVHAVITARLERLLARGSPTRRGGRDDRPRVPTAVLAAAAGRTEDDLTDDLDELWQHHIVRERGSAYDFSHDRLREVDARADQPGPPPQAAPPGRRGHRGAPRGRSRPGQRPPRRPLRRRGARVTRGRGVRAGGPARPPGLRPRRGHRAAGARPVAARRVTARCGARRGGAAAALGARGAAGRPARLRRAGGPALLRARAHPAPQARPPPEPVGAAWTRSARRGHPPVRPGRGDGPGAGRLGPGRHHGAHRGRVRARRHRVLAGRVRRRGAPPPRRHRLLPHRGRPAARRALRAGPAGGVPVPARPHPALPRPARRRRRDDAGGATRRNGARRPDDHGLRPRLRRDPRRPRAPAAGPAAPRSTRWTPPHTRCTSATSRSSPGSCRGWQRRPRR